MVQGTVKGLASHITKDTNTIQIKRKDCNHNENFLKLLEERMKMKFLTTCNPNDLQAVSWIGLIQIVIISNWNLSRPERSSLKPKLSGFIL